MMAQCATRRTSSLLCTVAILFALMTTSIVPAAAEVYNLEVAINGSTFVYKKLVSMEPAQLYATSFAVDLRVAVGGVAEISNVSLFLNDSALYVLYTATTTPPYTDADVRQKVAAAQLPTTNTALETVKTTFMESIDKNYDKMYPSNVRPFTPLLPPDETPTTPAPVITSVLNSTHTLYFTGDESAWRDVLQVAQVSLASAVSDAVVESMQHNNDKMACKTDNLAVRGADPTLTLPGDGRGGLTARVTVSQFVTAETQHAYTPLEVNSALSNINTSRIDDVYYSRVAASSSNPTIVCTTTPYSVVVAEVSPLLMWLLILIGGVIGALTIIAVIVIVLLVCCLPVCVRVSDGLSETSSWRSESRGSARSFADTDSYVSDSSVQSSKRGSQQSSRASSQSQRKSMSRNSSVRSSQSMSTRGSNSNMSATSTRLPAGSLPSHGSVSAQSLATPSAYAPGQSNGLSGQAAGQWMTPFPHNPLQSARY